LFEATVSLGSILTIVALVAAAVTYVVSSRYSGKSAAEILDTRLAYIEAQMEKFGQEMEKLAHVVIKLVEQSGRQDRVEDRQMAQGKRLDELQKSFNDWTGLNGLYDQKHRELDSRLTAIEHRR
jgi:hypothetical protein